MRYGAAKCIPQYHYGPPDFRAFEVVNPTDFAVFEGPGTRERRKSKPGWKEPEVRYGGLKSTSFYIDEVTHDLVWTAGLRQWIIAPCKGEHK